MVTEAEEIAAVQRRILLKETAEARGRPFSRSEAARFLSGQVGALRSARRRGLTTATLEQEQALALDPKSTPAPQVDLDAAQLRTRTRSDIAKDVLFGETGKQFIGVGTGVGRPKITAEEIKEFIKTKGGISGRTAALFIPETPLGVASTGAVVTLGGAPGIVGQLTKAALFGFGIKGALNPDLTLEERIASGIIAASPFVSPLLRFGKRKVPTFEQFKSSQKQLLKTKKGQQRFAELESFFKKKGKEKKSDLQKALDKAANRLTVRTERVGKKVTLRDTTAGEKIQFLRTSLEKARQTKDPKLRKKQIEGIVKFTKSELGEVSAKSLFRDLLAQEGFVKSPNFKSLIKKEVASSFVIPSVPTPQITPLSLEESVKVSRFDPTGFSKEALRNFERVKKANLRNNQRIATARSKDAQRKELFQSRTLDNKIKNDLRINSQIQKDKLRQLLSLRLNKLASQSLVQQQILQQRLVVQQSQIQLKTFAQRSALRLRPKLKGKRILKKPFAKSEGILKRKIPKPFAKLKKFQPFAKVSPASKNKFKALGKPTTLQKAKKRLFRKLDRTISSSGFINKNGKRVAPKRLPPAFRFSRNKKTPRLIVERKKFRINSPGEKLSLRQGKQSKKLPKPFKKRL